MIRLRRMLERGCAHPVLGPVLLIVLVLVLSMLFLHVAQDGHDAVSDLGAACVALAAALGLVLLERLDVRLARQQPSLRGDRGPPAAPALRSPAAAVVAVVSRSLPLRR